jgi:hypothetical protein
MHSDIVQRGLESRGESGRAMSKIIWGIVGIIALYFFFIYNDGAAFMSIADRFTEMFLEQLRQDGQL